jgi:hypothetical protein
LWNEWQKQKKGGHGKSFLDHDHCLIFLVSTMVLGLKQHYLWGHVGGMPCLSVANMPQMIPKFVLA